MINEADAERGPIGYALFDTTLGRAGIAWSARGIVAVQLPETSERETRTRLLQRFPVTVATEPPPEIQSAIDGIVALLRGERRDLSTAPLDMDGIPPFHRRVYEVALTIRPGRTLTYGAVATRLGEPGSARAVGQALGHNPFVIVVPCHRVLAAGGRIGGFSASGGRVTKLRLLNLEGAQTSEQPSLFDPPPDADA
jgi:methylated-DNA-[protein]-cysteine S-methyltransferase